MIHTREDQCTEWAERPLFRKNQELTPQRLNRVYEHYATRLRHALLGVAGTGIVYGFEIDVDDEGVARVKNGCIAVGCGLAIDKYGRQLFWAGGMLGACSVGGQPPDAAGRYTLFAHYAERHRGGEDKCGCDSADADWVEEGVVFTLRAGCEPTSHECPDLCGECIDVVGYVCERLGAGDLGDENLANLCKTPPRLCGVAKDDWLYDENAGLAIACVELCEVTDPTEECDCKFVFAKAVPGTCEYRTHVYRNPLLFDLFKGCHFEPARVASHSYDQWIDREWENPVAWNDFERVMDEGLTVSFTRPIATKTLHRTSIFVTAILREQESYWLDSLRLPVLTIEYVDEHNGFATGVHFRFDDLWCNNQLRTELTRFEFGATIELTIRGAMLRDECNRMLDARPIGFPEVAPGQEMPGNDFVATFRVCERPPDSGGRGRAGVRTR